MKTGSVVTSALLLFTLLASHAVVADTVYLKNGTRISGKVLDKGDKIEVEREHLEPLVIYHLATYLSM